MIDLITLKNFQRHTNTELVLSPRINVITGENDQGKSSIIRALYWLFFNRPISNNFLQYHKKEISVTAHTEDCVVRRRKNKKGSVNKYEIGTTINKLSDYSAPRTNVPEKVQEFGITSTNIQMQDDPPFLLCLTPGEAARKLNSIVGLDQIDHSIKHVNTVIKNSTSREKHLKKDIEEKKKQLKKYENLEDIKKQYKEYDALQERLTTLDEQKKTISNLILSLDEAFSIIAYEQDIDRTDTFLKKMSETTAELEKLKEQLLRLDKSINFITHTEKLIEIHGQKQKKIAKTLEKLRTLSNKYNAEEQRKQQITKQINQLYEQRKQHKNIERSKKKADKKYKKLKLELKVCPFCSAPLINEGK